MLVAPFTLARRRLKILRGETRASACVSVAVGLGGTSAGSSCLC